MSRGILVLAVAVLALGLVLPGVSSLGRGRTRACPGGRFLVRTGPLLEPGVEHQAVVIEGDRVSIGDVCPPVRSRVRKRHGAVVVTAVWPACRGVAGKGRLQAMLALDCATMRGTFLARRSQVKEQFAARRSRCGDGILDPPGSEECDGGTEENEVDPTGTELARVGARGTGCATDKRCTDDCACVSDEPGHISFTRQVLPILTARCATSTCHGGVHPQQNLDLRAETAYEQLINVTSTQCVASKRVVPGAPDASYLLAKLRGSGPCFAGIRMPPGSTLSATDLAAISSWVAQGAPRN